jgi:hypothetical protein
MAASESRVEVTSRTLSSLSGFAYEQSRVCTYSSDCTPAPASGAPQTGGGQGERPCEHPRTAKRTRRYRGCLVQGSKGPPTPNSHPYGSAINSKGPTTWLASIPIPYTLPNVRCRQPPALAAWPSLPMTPSSSPILRVATSAVSIPHQARSKCGLLPAARNPNPMASPSTLDCMVRYSESGGSPTPSIGRASVSEGDRRRPLC